MSGVRRGIYYHVNKRCEERFPSPQVLCDVLPPSVVKIEVVIIVAVVRIAIIAVVVIVAAVIVAVVIVQVCVLQSFSRAVKHNILCQPLICFNQNVNVSSNLSSLASLLQGVLMVYCNAMTGVMIAIRIGKVHRLTPPDDVICR